MFFWGVLSSGAGVTEKINTLTQGAVVDWATLGWVLLAAWQFVLIVIDRVLYLKRYNLHVCWLIYMYIYIYAHT